ncbi:MAG: aromatic-ring-hydroxylating dioxygenase subunit beta [bacterium]
MTKIADLSHNELMLLHFEVEQFLYREANLLDERHFDEWIELLTEDIHYWMPIRRTTTSNQPELEFTSIGGMALFDDNLDFLKMRVAKLGASNAWSEEPPSRTRHSVSNVRIVDAEDNGRIVVACNFQLYRTRLESEEDSWIGCRKDWLERNAQGHFKLAQRHIFLDQTTILSQNMSTLF